jgi:GntR family transcriptional regulator, transcriptional repressor for pyruvate dehydrogenase complex
MARKAAEVDGDWDFPKIERPEPVSGEVARRLLPWLLSGGVQIGDRLPSERVLASQLGVGRSAIREGLRPLVLLGVLEVRPGSGTYLRAATSDLLPDVIEWGLLLGNHIVEDMVEARVEIEISLARLAATRCDAALVDRMRSILEEMRTAESVQAFTEADLAFHLILANGSGNSVLAGVLRNIRSLLAVWIRRVREQDSADVLFEQHVAIADAVEARDGDAAAAAMKSHMDRVAGALRETLRREQAKQAAAEA